MTAERDSRAVGATVYRFGDFTLDLGRGVLSVTAGAELPLRPKAFGLLCLMVSNAGRLIGRDEIFASVWPGVFVTEDSISLCVRQIRAALGDTAGQMVRTVPRRGYLFAAEVTRFDATLPPRSTEVAVLASHPDGIPPAQLATRSAGPPTLVVLPFDNMSADPEQGYFADGITEDLTTALSQLRWFAVIARNSAFTYKGRAVDVRQVGRELGVGYTLEGSIRKAGERVRITAQLCDAETGQHIWADRFDGDLADIFQLQDRVTDAVVGALGPSLRQAEVNRTRSRPTESLTTYDLYLRALPHRYTTRAANDEALLLLRRAVMLDPGFMAAQGALAELHTVRFNQGWAGPGDVEEAIRCARQVADGGEDDPNALAAAARTLSYLARDFEAGLGAADRALLLAPNSSAVLLANGLVRGYVGDAATALALVERARQLSPVDPCGFYFSTAACLAHFVSGQFEDAAACARRAIRERPTYLAAHRFLATSLAQLGRLEEAKEALGGLLALSPGYTATEAEGHIVLWDEVPRQLFVDGLRKAGLPE